MIEGEGCVVQAPATLIQGIFGLGGEIKADCRCPQLHFLFVRRRVGQGGRQVARHGPIGPDSWPTHQPEQ